MQKLDLDDFDTELPGHMNVAVLMEKQPSTHPWADFRYEALGVVVAEESEKSVKKVFQEGEVERFLVSGLRIRLFVDECESYYHNMMSPRPGCYIVANQPDNSAEMPLPYLVSLSFDEANSYLQGDEQVYAVPIPRELYQWVEAYLLTHYVAEKKTKRRLKNWHDPKRPQHGGRDS